MASSSNVPAKTPPLNNSYDLPFKWAKDSKRRRSGSSSQNNKSPSSLSDNSDATVPTTSLPPPPPPQRRYRSPPDSSFRSSGWDSESEARGMSMSRSRVYHNHQGEGSNSYRDRGEKRIRHDPEFEAHRYTGHHSRNHHHHHHQGSGRSNLYHERDIERPKKKTKAEEADVAGVKRSSKFLIKIPCRTNKPAEEVEKQKNEDDDKEEGEIKDDECGIIIEEGEIRDDVGDEKVVEEGDKNPSPRIAEETRVWNLRPRKPISKGNEGEIKTSTKNGNNKSKENKGNGGDGGEKKKPHKIKLSINVALTKQEIEEDFFAWTGAKPPRKPQKRARDVQKLVNLLCPGLQLTGISVDSYKS